MLRRLLLSLCFVLTISAAATAEPISPFYVEWVVTETHPANPAVNVEAAVSATRKQLLSQHVSKENLASIVELSRRNAEHARSGWHQSTVIEWRIGGDVIQRDNWAGKEVSLDTPVPMPQMTAEQHTSTYETKNISVFIGDTSHLNNPNDDGQIGRPGEPEVSDGEDSLPMRCLLLGQSTDRLLHSKRANIQRTADHITVTLDRTHQDPNTQVTWYSLPLRIQLTEDGKRILKIDTLQRFSGALVEQVIPSDYATVYGVTLPRTITVTSYENGKAALPKVYTRMALRRATPDDVVRLKTPLQRSTEFSDTRFGEPYVWYPSVKSIPTEDETRTRFEAARREHQRSIFLLSALLILITAGVTIGIFYAIRRGAAIGS